MDDNLAANDPYRGMKTGSDEIRPDLGGGAASGGAEKSKTDQRRDAAADGLKSAEQAATGNGVGQAESGLAGARRNEEAAGGFFSGSGKKPKVKKAGFRGRFSRGGPIFGIIFAIFGVGGLMTGAQFFQPFSLIAQFQESFNSMHVSANARSERFFRMQMESGRTRNPVKGTIFGETFKITKKQNAELKKQGIEFDDTTFKGADGKPIKVLKYDDGSGEIKIVAADQNAADQLNRMNLAEFNTEEVKFDTEATYFKKLYMDSPDFFSRYNAGSMTWRGQIANWFGTKTSSFLKTNKLTRNLWSDYKQKAAEAEASGRTRLDVVKETIESRLTDVEGGGVARRTDAEEDEDGKVKGDTRTDGDTTVNSNSKVKAENITSKLNDIKGKISGGVNVGCAVADFIGAVSLIVAANEAMQIINLAMSYMEAIDKTKAGYGDEAPINEIGDTLNAQATADYVVLEYDEIGQTVSNSDGSGTMYAKSKTVEGSSKTAMQSAAMAGIYGNGYVNPNDPSVQSFNLTGRMSTILGGIGMGINSFKTCAVSRAAAAAASVTFDVLSCVFTLCLAGLIKDAIISIGIGFALSAVISLITPWVVSALTRNIISTLAGEDLGNALVFGANMYQGNTHKSNGGSLATKEKYTSFAVVQQQVIAEEARLERESLSPFDITSKNTFMGAVMTKMMSFMTTNSVMSNVATSGSVVSSSLVGLMPSTSAIASQIAESLPTDEEYEKTCPYLASIGAVGDSACNPYMVTDMSTMDFDPVGVINEVYSLGGLEDDETSDGNVIIKKDSDLMKYITYCGERVSAFGVADQNIASEFKLGTGSSVLDQIIGNAPLLGDIADLYDSNVTLKNIGYIGGESCVAGNAEYADYAEESPSWNRAKWYQRFIEDQSLAESMGIIDKSAVTVALEEYYKENPLDNSYEGMLARYSGLTKETVSDALDIIAYFNFVSEYDPSERYAFGESEVEMEGRVLFDDEYVLAGGAVLPEEIIYRDVRNRSFAV